MARLHDHPAFFQAAGCRVVAKSTTPYGSSTDRACSSSIRPLAMTSKARVPVADLSGKLPTATSPGTLDLFGSSGDAKRAPAKPFSSCWGQLSEQSAAQNSARSARGGPATGNPDCRCLAVDSTGGDFATGSVGAHRDVSSSLAYRGRRSHFTDHLAGAGAGAGLLRNGTFAAFTSPRR